MQIEVLKSKIHRAVITRADLNYIGSITIDEDLMDAANLIENEKVQVVNLNNGERLETYLIKGKRASGICCLNGPPGKGWLAILSLSFLMLQWNLKKPKHLNHGSFFRKKETNLNSNHYFRHCDLNIIFG